MKILCTHAFSTVQVLATKLRDACPFASVPLCKLCKTAQLVSASLMLRKGTVSNQGVIGAWVPANARNLACLSALTAAKGTSADRDMTHALWTVNENPHRKLMRQTKLLLCTCTGCLHCPWRPQLQKPAGETPCRRHEAAPALATICTSVCGHPVNPACDAFLGHVPKHP